MKNIDIKKIASLFVLVLLTISITSAQRIKSKTVNLSHFTEIKIKGAFEVILEKGDVEKVEIEADADQFDEIKAFVSSEELRIGNEFNWDDDDINIGDEDNDHEHTATIHIYYKNIEALSLKGAADISSKSVIKSDNFRLFIEGASETELRLEVDKLHSKLRGAFSVELKGKAKDVEWEIAGVGALSAEDLVTQNADLEFTGIGDVNIHVTNYLDANLMGLGNVTCYGHPKKIDKNSFLLGNFKTK